MLKTEALVWLTVNWIINLCLSEKALQEQQNQGSFVQIGSKVTSILFLKKY